MSVSSVRSSSHTAAITRLTALWALAESGLGGVLFALKLPFTGFLIGAVSVIVLSFIAKLSGNSAKQLLGATVLVLLVKAGASPHSPPAAYLAVAFQGCLAALLFSTIRLPLPAAILLGALSMMESAGQKLILLTLVFGKSFWEAVEQFAGSIAKLLGRQPVSGSAMVVAGIYLALYALWGVVVGLVAARLPARLERSKEAVLAAYRQSQTADGPTLKTAVRRRKKILSFFVLGAVLAGILFFLYHSGKSRVALLWVFGRSVLMLLLLFFVVRPLAKRLFAKWVSRRTVEKQKEIGDIVALLPQVRDQIRYAWRTAAAASGSYRRAGAFLRIVLILTLYADE